MKIGFRLTHKQWIILATILVGLAAGIGYYCYQRSRKLAAMATTGTDGEAKVIPLPDPKLLSDCPNDSFPLKYGKCGKRVEQFQLYLIKQFGAQFTQHGPDGKWGDETEAVARKFILKNSPFSISEDYFNKTAMGTYKTLKYA